MTEGAIRRGEATARRSLELTRAEIRRSQLNPVSQRRENYELPESFVSQALPRLEALLKIGAWDQLKRAVDTLALEYELRAKEAATPERTNGTLAASHVTWLNLPMRTTNIIEDVCAGTVGSLLECFPQGFVNVPNCGPEAVKAIAKALVRCRALTPEDAALRVQAWYAAMERR